MRFLKWKRAPKPSFDAPLQPNVPFFAVGDIHGCDDLFARLLARLDERAHPGRPLVTVGDYVDRGEQSREVLERLQRLQAGGAPGEMICLKGNHEQMLLEFLDDPAERGERWLRHGGLQTLASYRVPVALKRMEEAQWLELRDRFRETLGSETEAWLRALPLTWQTGNVCVLHAAADPALPIPAQSEATLLWGHAAFESTPRRDATWVVHGHTVVEHARPVLGRIPVDTGAYATGQLTCALVEPGNVEFLKG